MERRGKYIVYDKYGKLVIITKDKRVAITHARLKK
jgi:predicted metal-dependent phosphotriesterase family hydrolase